MESGTTIGERRGRLGPERAARVSHRHAQKDRRVFCWKMTEREFRISRGQTLELLWQQLLSYQEQVEDIVRRNGGGRKGQAYLEVLIEHGAVRVIYFFGPRACFEATWYGRAPWMRNQPNGIAGQV